MCRSPNAAPGHSARQTKMVERSQPPDFYSVLDKVWVPDVLQEMRAGGELLDLDLRSRSEGGDWVSCHAHSLIMALVSPVLRRMIAWERAKASATPGVLTLELEEVDSEVVGAFVEFVYHGSVSQALDIRLLFALGQLADRLDVEPLQRAVAAQVQELLSVDTCAPFLPASRLCGMPELEDCWTRFALLNFAEVAAHPSFPCLDWHVLEGLVADDRLHLPCEEAVLEALVVWRLRRQQEGLQEGAHDAAAGWRRLLDCVRFSILDTAYLQTRALGLANELGCSEIRHRIHLALDARGVRCVGVAADGDEDCEMPAELSQGALQHGRMAYREIERGGSGPGLTLRRRLSVAAEIHGNSGPIEAVAFYRGSVISGGRDGCVKLFSAASSRPECVLAAHPRGRVGMGPAAVGGGEHAEQVPYLGAVHAVMVHGDTLFIGSQDKEWGPINAWCLQTRRHVHSLAGHSDAVMCLCARATELYSASWDSTVRVWDMRTFQTLRVLQCSAGPIVALAVCRDVCVAVGIDRLHVQRIGAQRQDDALCLHELESVAGRDPLLSVAVAAGPVVRSGGALDQGGGSSSAVAFHSEGRLITGHRSGLIRVWNTSSWRCVLLPGLFVLAYLVRGV